MGWREERKKLADQFSRFGLFEQEANERARSQQLNRYLDERAARQQGGAWEPGAYTSPLEPGSAARRSFEPTSDPYDDAYKGWGNYNVPNSAWPDNTTRGQIRGGEAENFLRKAGFGFGDQAQEAHVNAVANLFSDLKGFGPKRAEQTVDWLYRQGITEDPTRALMQNPSLLSGISWGNAGQDFTNQATNYLTNRPFDTLSSWGSSTGWISKHEAASWGRSDRSDPWTREQAINRMENVSANPDWWRCIHCKETVAPNHFAVFAHPS